MMMEAEQKEEKRAEKVQAPVGNQVSVPEGPTTTYPAPAPVQEPVAESPQAPQTETQPLNLNYPKLASQDGVLDSLDSSFKSFEMLSSLKKQSRMFLLVNEVLGRNAPFVEHIIDYSIVFYKYVLSNTTEFDIRHPNGTNSKTTLQQIRDFYCVLAKDNKNLPPFPFGNLKVAPKINYYEVDMRIAIFFMGLIYHPSVKVQQETDRFFKNPGCFSEEAKSLSGNFIQRTLLSVTEYMKQASFSTPYKKQLGHLKVLLKEQINYYQQLEKSQSSKADVIRMNLLEAKDRLCYKGTETETDTAVDSCISAAASRLKENMIETQPKYSLLLESLVELYTICDIAALNITEEYDIVNLFHVEKNIALQIRKMFFQK